jgi:hypothetical protein
VPEGLLALGLFKGEQLNFAVAFKWARCIPLHPAFTFVFGISLWILNTFVKSAHTSRWVSDFTNDNFLSELL